jgi:small-conductance mechanosensitive channel
LSEKIAQKFNIETHIPQMNAVYRIEGEQVSQLEEGYLLDSDEIEKKEFKKDKKLVLDDRIKEFEAIIETIERSDEEMIEADKRQALLHEIEALKDLADEILTKTEDAIENKQIRIKNYKQLNNLIKELEKTLVNLSLNNTQENFK